MVDQRSGNAIAAEQREKAAAREEEAWKLAQLAATLAIGREGYSSFDQVAPAFVEQAEALLNAARKRVDGS